MERYSYTETDVVLRNTYFGPEYPDKAARQAFFAVEENDVFASVTGLKAPGFPGPLAMPQIADYPLNVRKIDARVTVRSAADRAIVLDGTGYETERRADFERAGDRIRIDLPEDAIYTLLR